MSQFLTDVVTGLVNGGIYALIACGLVLTYTTTGIFNLGYAGIAFSSAYVFFELNSGLGWSQWAAAGLVVLVLCPLLGLLLDAAIFRRLAHASETAQIVASVGVLLALPAVCTFVVGRGIAQFDWGLPIGTDVHLAPGLGPQPQNVWRPLGELMITSDQLIVLGTAIVCVVLLHLFLTHTQRGLHMRAVADRRDLALLRGVDEARTSRLAWVLGTMLAGVAGVVGAPILRTLDPGTFTLAMFVAIAAAVVGRLRSVLLAFAGALGVGVLTNLTFSYADFANAIPGFNNTVPFLLLIGGLVLMARSRARVAGTIASEPPPPSYTGDLPAWRRLLVPTVALVLLTVGILVTFDSFWLGLVTRGLIFGLIFLSFTIVTGVGGMVSLAQTAFVTGAGLLTGTLMTRYDVPWLLALLGAVAAATALGVLVALPSLRLGGVALALATLALAFVCGQVLFQWDWLRNGERGWRIEAPTFGPFELGDARTMAIATLILILLVIGMIRNLERSNTGREMLAVRNASAAARSIGISPIAVRVKVFGLSAAVAGLGGVLLATHDVVVTSRSTTPIAGLLWLAGVVLVGVRRPAGAVAAGLTLTLLPGFLRGFTLPFGLASWSGSTAPEVSAILFGLGAIALARQPDGVFQDISRRSFERREVRRRRAAQPVSPALAAGGPTGDTRTREVIG
jgi:branched-subunit amino acid ABC-type transport system permease component